MSLKKKKFELPVLFPEAHPPGTGDTYFQSLGSGGPFACAPGAARYEGEGCQIGLENGPPQINFETRKVEGVPMDTQFDKGEIFEAFLNSLDDLQIKKFPNIQKKGCSTDQPPPLGENLGELVLGKDLGVILDVSPQKNIVVDLCFFFSPVEGGLRAPQFCSKEGGLRAPQCCSKGGA